MRLIPTIVSSLIVGLAVVFVLPFGTGLLDRIQEPTARAVLGNRLVQVIMVGLITSVGISIFTGLARSLRVAPR